MLRRCIGPAIAVAAVGLLASVASASASTAGEIGGLPIVDALNRSETPLSNGGKWSALAWDASTTNKTGRSTTSGWGPSDIFPSVNGAYWNQGQFGDTAGGDAAEVTMQVEPGIESRYVALWLDMASPASTQSGYQLSWTELPKLGTYTVALAKWSAGTKTVLASSASVSIPAGTTLAISDTGGTVEAWQGSGGSLTPILSASDSSYSSGYAGIEGAGNLSRSVNFQAGGLVGKAVTGMPVLDNLQRQEVPLATGKWSKPAWAAGIGGAWNTGGWLGYGSPGGLEVNAAYWNPTTFSDATGGDGVAATMTVAPTDGQYLALWLNMPNPATTESGYEARWTYRGATGAFDLELSKWTAGARTALASKSSFAIPAGTTIALTENGGGVTVWTGTTSFSPALAVSDTTYTSGYAGMQVVGGAPTQDNFQAGPLAPPTEPPGMPSVSSVSPSSPANNNLPKVIGGAAGGSTVNLYANATCAGAPVASGSATSFASPGITASVADNTTTTFHATASNTAGASACSTSSVTYTEDSTPPAAPTVSSTNPVSGSNNNSPKVIGSAESGSTVKLYTNSTCTSAVAASGTAAAFVSPGLTVSVGDNTTTTFRATATDAAGNASSCSSTSVTYVEASPKVYWGAWLGGNAYSTPEKEYGDGPWDSETWNLFEKHAGKKISIEHFGQPAPWNQAFAAGPLNLTRERGAIPLMDMDPDGVTLKEIVEGKKDSYFTTWAKAVKAWGYPMFFRWTWEMNGTWFQYGAEAAANPTLYKEAWWHLHNIVEEQGASNVTWVWCPNLSFPGSTSFTSLYPGDKYVDWTCLDGYNFGTNPAQPDSWKSFSTLYTPSYNELLSLAPTKPIMIGEMASTEYGGSKASWITDAIGTQIPKNFPKIKAIVWYNKWDGGKDWPIETSSSSESAFAGAIASTYYAGNTFGSLPTLTKIEPLP
jgi:Glycosyl hydrolase family 26